MRDISISIGKGRRDTNWIEHKMCFDDFVKRLEEPKRTLETFKDYTKMTKDQQSNIKDIGGFVGGKLRSGRRIKTNLLYRDIITLDADNADTVFSQKVFDTLEMRTVVYSTHSHSKEKPRYRVIIPLQRSVTYAEYIVISRILIDKIGNHYIDKTSVEPERLMYWPSASIDAEYIFQDNRVKAWLSPDDLIKNHPLIAQKEVPPQNAKKIKGADKEGPIGAFCRNYDIHQVVAEFLPDVYLPTGDSNRYTYVNGSTFGGLVVYDNGEEAYSHHQTDPAYGQHSHNAFDLLRIHKFSGDVDRTLKYIYKLGPVQEERFSEEFQESYEDFKKNKGDVRKLEWGEKGLLSTINNYMVLIDRHFDIKRNEFTRTNEIDGKSLDNLDDTKILEFMENKYKIYNQEKCSKAIDLVAINNEYHPIKKYFEELPEWDGVPRVDKLFIDYFGSPDTEYVRMVSRIMMTSAVRRVIEPGCEYQNIIVLNGPTGIGKSYLFRKLAGPWFNDSFQLGDTRDKTGPEKLDGYWIIEIPELSGISKASVETVKAFITRQDDIYRPAYKKRAEKMLRQSIFVGTTNAETGYLKDLTGNRRVWPIPVFKRSTDELSIDQLWAEALAKYKDTPNKLSYELELEAEKMQNAQIETDDKQDVIEDYVEMQVPRDWYSMEVTDRTTYTHSSEAKRQEIIKKAGGYFVRESVSSLEIWIEFLKGDIKLFNRKEQNEITATLRKMGYTQRMRRNDKFYSKKLSCFKRYNPV